MNSKSGSSSEVASCKRRGQQQLMQGDAAGALQQFDHALLLTDDDAELFFCRGLALRRLGRNGEALASYEKALILAPGQPDWLCNYGNALQETGKLAEALVCFDRAVLAAPQTPLFAYNRANLLMRLGRYEKALEGFDDTLRLDPEMPEAWNNRGNALLELKRPDDARASFAQALALDPSYAEAMSNRGAAWLELDQPESAMADFEASLRLDQGDVDALNGMGMALQRLDRFDEAEERFNQALRMDPSNSDVRYNRGLLELRRCNFEKACAEFEALLKLDSSVPDTWSSLGMALMSLGRMTEAGDCFERALKINPAFPAALHNRGLLSLFLGRFDAAWPDYEVRLDARGSSGHLRKQAASIEAFLRMPRWAGPVPGDRRRISIWAEQGIGDHILFLTLLPELLASEVRVVCEVDRRLLGAYRRAFPKAEFVAWSDPPDKALTGADAALFAGSLPKFYRSDAASFSRQPGRVLSALPDRVAHYSGQFGEEFKVALSWRSTRTGWIGRGKSALLDDFAMFSRLPQVRLIDVQYGDTATERAQAHERYGLDLFHVDEIDYFDDLEEVLAIIEACDLLVTTSNANAHFAGALGKPALLLYPGGRPPFHYWAHDGSYRSRWYPSVELISSDDNSGWPALVARVVERVESRIADRRR